MDNLRETRRSNKTIICWHRMMVGGVGDCSCSGSDGWSDKSIERVGGSVFSCQETNAIIIIRVRQIK